MKQEIVELSPDIAKIKENCAEEIQKFGVIFQEIQLLYRVLGLYYPEECNTNYRDSWFHYRKLYNKKDMISVLNEKYGLEEHLLRASKDAQICLLQQIGYWLDVWYRCDEFMEYDEDEAGKFEVYYQRMDGNWVKSLNEAMIDDKESFAKACLFYYVKYISTEDVRKKIQNLVHNIKNLILDLRLGGVNIARPSDNIKYFEQCVSVYKDMCCSLKDKKILYLLSSTDIILQYCGR